MDLLFGTVEVGRAKRPSEAAILLLLFLFLVLLLEVIWKRSLTESSVPANAKKDVQQLYIGLLLVNTYEEVSN